MTRHIDARAPVREVLGTAVVPVDAGATLRAAACTMCDAQVGALPVLDADGLAGIVTERDIVSALADGRDPDRTEVRTVMSIDPRYITLGDSVATAAEVMLDVGCRHLPVVDEGVVVGIVSIRDVARAID